MGVRIYQGNVVTLAGTETLTNKTLTTPALTGLVAFSGSTQAAGTDAMTIGNGPAGTAGNPDLFLKVSVGGTTVVIPGWTPT